MLEILDTLVHFGLMTEIWGLLQKQYLLFYYVGLRCQKQMLVVWQ